MKLPKDIPMYPALRERYKRQEQRISSCGSWASHIHKASAEAIKIEVGTIYSKWL